MAQGATAAQYLPHGPFRAALHQRVAEHFAKTGTVPNEARGIRIKTAVIMAWFVGSYLTLLLTTSAWWVAALLSVSLGLAMAAIGFNIQHDGNHGSFSSRQWLNTLGAMGLDVLGGSSYVWRWKHNIFHHSNPNIVGWDADIDIQPFVRLAPSQQQRPMHRFQHLYIWVLYSLLAFKWHFVDDFRDVASGRIAGQSFPRPKGSKLVIFVLGKIGFFTWAFVIPLAMHPVASVLGCYAIASATLSLTLALVFQLAHAVEGATFPRCDGTSRMSTEWAVHQAESSLNFAPNNPVVTWYCGGLNYQIEHHLFPKVSHLHLKGLSTIVQNTCAEFGVQYRVNPTVTSALTSHARWIRSMGVQPAPASQCDRGMGAGTA